MQKKKKIIVVLITIVFLPSMAFLMTAQNFKRIIDPKLILLQNITVTDEKIDIKLTFLDSVTLFAGYEVQKIEDVIYLTIYGTIFKLFQDGNRNISIPNNTKNLNKIYLKANDPANDKLIWSKMMRSKDN